MNISIERLDNTLTLALDGRLDTNTAPQLEAVLQENLAGTEHLVLDFKDLVYISSAGLRVLLSSQKTMSRQGTLVLKNVSEAVMDVLEITGFSDILTIE